MSNSSYEAQFAPLENIPVRPKRRKARWDALASIGVALVASTLATFVTYLGLILGGVSTQVVAMSLFGSSILLFSAAGVGVIFGAVLLVSLLVALASTIYMQSQETKKLEVRYQIDTASLSGLKRDRENAIADLARHFKIPEFEIARKDTGAIIQTMRNKISEDQNSLTNLKEYFQEQNLVTPEAVSGITSLEALYDYLQNHPIPVRDNHRLADTVLLPGDDAPSGYFGSGSSSMGLPESTSLSPSEGLDDSHIAPTSSLFAPAKGAQEKEQSPLSTFSAQSSH